MQRASRRASRLAVPWLLFAGALALRLYGLSRDPLWYDELHGYVIGRLGLAGVLQNSLAELHPPLYYLLQWLAAGLGGIHEEWAWRWLPAVSGALVVPVVYGLARRVTGQGNAILAATLLAVAATPYYFSQEARGYAFVLLLSALSMRIVQELQRQPGRARWWVGYAALVVAGIACEYSLVFMPAVQLPYLALTLRRRKGVALTSAALACVALPLLALAGLFARWIRFRANLEPLGLVHTMQTLLVWETARYGFAWPNTVLPPVFAMLVALGLWHVLRNRELRAFGAYAALQLIVPPAAFFLVGTRLLDLRLPVYEGKQFMVVLPALYVLVAAGLAQLRELPGRPLGAALAIALCGLVAAGSLDGLARYWGQTKNPEGLAVLAMRPALQPGDAVVTLHYRLDYVAQFYVRDDPAVTASAHPDYYPADLVAYARPVDPAVIVAIRRHPRIWILSNEAAPSAVYETLLSACTIAARQETLGIEVLRAEHCVPAEGPPTQ